MLNHVTILQAWLLWKENKTLPLMDECLSGMLVKSQVERCIRVGLLCVQKLAEDTPDMISVCSMLSSDNEVIQLEPKGRGFLIERSSNTVRTSQKSIGENFEEGTMTISDLRHDEAVLVSSGL